MSKKNEAKNMSDYDYKEEANKLKAKRNFGFDFYYSINTDKAEKELSEHCKKYWHGDLETYKQAIEDILDELEKYKDKLKDKVDLNCYYLWFIEDYMAFDGEFHFTY